MGFRRIVFLNGHYDNTYAIAYACAKRAPSGCRLAARAFPVNYWDGMTADEAAEFFDPSNGLHANKGETAAVLAIDPGSRGHGARPTMEFPPFPEVTSPAPVHTAFFFSAPGLGAPRDRAPGPGVTPARPRPSSASATCRW